MVRNSNWWTNSRMVKRGLDMVGFFKAKAQKDKKNKRKAEEMPDHGEDRQDYLAYLNAHEEGVTTSQFRKLEAHEALSLPPPLDDPECWVSGGPRFAPLLGGTVAEEGHLINEKLQRNAARESKRALAAGEPDPWAGAPYPPHHYIPENGRPRHPTPVKGRGVTAGVSGKGGVGKVVAGPLVSSVVASEEYSQRPLRGNSGRSKRVVRGAGGRGAPILNNGALSPIQEGDEVEETSGANFPVASIEAAPTKPAGPRGTKRPSSLAAGAPPAKKPRTSGRTLGLVTSSTIIDPAAVRALANAQPEPSRRIQKRRATDVEEEDRAIKRPKTTEVEPQPIRRSARIQSREPSVGVVPPPSPPRQPAISTVDLSQDKVKPSRLKPSAAASKKSEYKAAVTKVTKTTKRKNETAAKPKRKKVQRACDECRRKHVSCKHGVNAPDYVAPQTIKDEDSEDDEKTVDPPTTTTSTLKRRSNKDDDQSPPPISRSTTNTSGDLLAAS